MRSFIFAGLAALVTAQSNPIPVVGLENEPIVFVSVPPTIPLTITAESFLLDSLRVVVMWNHPADSLGQEDSTAFRVRATRTIRFMGGGTVAPETWRRRKFVRTQSADTFKVLRPAVGDSVIFTTDSIQQFRTNLGSVPGSAAWGYKRTQAPPAMTFIRVTTDSF